MYAYEQSSITIFIFSIYMHVYVLTIFTSYLIIYFSLFFSMPIYDNGYKTKENENWTKGKIEHI